MLDDHNVLGQRDPSGLLKITEMQYEQLKMNLEVINGGKAETISNIVIASLGGSALAALFVKFWLKSVIKVPIEIVRTYDLPGYVDNSTLVVACSYSGNTEETINCFMQAQEKGAFISAIASGGKLIEYADKYDASYIKLPLIPQPRMGVISNIRSLVMLFADYGLISAQMNDEIAVTYEWLKAEILNWSSDMATEKNFAKQLALKALGKTSVFYGGSFSAPLANKFKISINENAKNVAFFNELPESNHNEFTGWTSHPVEKPYAVFDIISSFENPQILKRFEVTDRLLSGLRPKATTINLNGDSMIKQLLWGNALADFVGVYHGILNNVDPMPVPYVDKLKKELG